MRTIYDKGNTNTFWNFLFYFQESGAPAVAMFSNLIIGILAFLIQYEVLVLHQSSELFFLTPLSPKFIVSQPYLQKSKAQLLPVVDYHESLRIL
jgi:hypothetical protein